jgi:hypothetical protein
MYSLTLRYAAQMFLAKLSLLCRDRDRIDSGPFSRNGGQVLLRGLLSRGCVGRNVAFPALQWPPDFRSVLQTVYGIRVSSPLSQKGMTVRLRVPRALKALERVEPRMSLSSGPYQTIHHWPYLTPPMMQPSGLASSAASYPGLMPRLPVT